MTTLTYPVLSFGPATFLLRLRPNTLAFSSPLNRAVQTAELPGALWIGELSYDSRTLIEADRLLLQAWLAQLRGRAGRFFMSDLSMPAPKGVATGTPVVAGAAQTGASLATSGWTASVTNILKTGDLIGVNGELKRIVANASSSGTGTATLTFEPPLRASPANLAAIVTAAPTFTAMLADDDQDHFLVQPPLQSDVTLKFSEAF